MAPITWQNIHAPNLSNTLLLGLTSAGQDFNNAFNTWQGGISNYQALDGRNWEQTAKNNTADYTAQIQQFQNYSDLANAAGRFSPATLQATHGVQQDSDAIQKAFNTQKDVLSGKAMNAGFTDSETAFQKDFDPANALMAFQNSMRSAKVPETEIQKKSAEYLNQTAEQHKLLTDQIIDKHTQELLPEVTADNYKQVIQDGIAKYGSHLFNPAKIEALGKEKETTRINDVTAASITLAMQKQDITPAISSIIGNEKLPISTRIAAMENLQKVFKDSMSVTQKQLLEAELAKATAMGQFERDSRETVDNITANKVKLERTNPLLLDIRDKAKADPTGDVTYNGIVSQFATEGWFKNLLPSGMTVGDEAQKALVDLRTEFRNDPELPVGAGEQILAATLQSGVGQGEPWYSSTRAIDIDKFRSAAKQNMQDFKTHDALNTATTTLETKFNRTKQDFENSIKEGVIKHQLNALSNNLSGVPTNASDTINGEVPSNYIKEKTTTARQGAAELNNPMMAVYVGQKGASPSKTVNEDGLSFAQWATLAEGEQAAVSQWEKYAKRGLTLEQAWLTATPDTKANPNVKQHILDGAKELGLDPKKPIPADRLEDVAIAHAARESTMYKGKTPFEARNTTQAQTAEAKLKDTVKTTQSLEQANPQLVIETPAKTETPADKEKAIRLALNGTGRGGTFLDNVDKFMQPLKDSANEGSVKVQTKLQKISDDVLNKNKNLPADSQILKYALNENINRINANTKLSSADKSLQTAVLKQKRRELEETTDPDKLDEIKLTIKAILADIAKRNTNES